MILDQLQSVLDDQIDGYRRLREADRASRRAHRRHDGDALECILAEQVTTLRELAELRRERRRILDRLHEEGKRHWPPRD